VHVAARPCALRIGSLTPRGPGGKIPSPLSSLGLRSVWSRVLHWRDFNDYGSKRLEAL